MRPLSGAREKPSPSANPLDADEFAALMQPFAGTRRFAVAVSGGPDSMALAFCMKRWGKPCMAFIVDHALRPESAREAEETHKRLKAIGVESEILRWEHAPVVTRLHVTARKARYALLAEACRRHGIGNLVLAHQREDQAETILMRLAKGSGVDGLAGMETESEMDGVRLLRPLLNIPKERLIATCRTAKLDFVEDASNSSGKFARGRLRKVLPLLAEEGLTVERLIDLGARARDAKDALDYYTIGFLRAATSRDAAGVIRIESGYLRSVPQAIAARALGFGLQDIHPDDYPPEHESLMRLLGALLADEPMTPRTLYGCLVSKTETQVTLMRETANITDAPAIKSGESIVWDSRWRVTLDEIESSPFTIRPLGHPEHEVLDDLAPGLRKKVPQGRARAGLPALWQGEKLAIIPSLDDSGPAQAQLVSEWPQG